MYEERGGRVVTAHFDGERLVLDEPQDLPIGVVLKVYIPSPDPILSPEGALAALEGFVGMGKNLPRLEDRYIDDRDTYYEGRC